MVGYRRHKNLIEILSPAAYPRTNILKPPNAGCNKCTSKCYVFSDFLIESSTITSVATGLSYKIKDALPVRTIGLFTVPSASNVKSKMCVPHSQTFTLAGATIKAIYIYIRVGRLVLWLNTSLRNSVGYII